MRAPIRLVSFIAFVVTVALVCGVVVEAPAQQNAKRNFTYAEAYGGGRGGGAILGRTPQITGWADDDHYLEVRTGSGGRQVYAVNAESGSAEVYRDFSDIQANLPAGFNANQAAATTDDLTGFVFKIQANMDPAHHDRVAFLRITSGRFSKGMKVRHVRLGRDMAVHNAMTFMASRRGQAEEAFAGDIIGAEPPLQVDEPSNNFSNGEFALL